jgi:hypothetical protein
MRSEGVDSHQLGKTPMKNVQIASFHFHRDGEQARGYLADAGIGSLLHSDAGQSTNGPRVDRVRLFVREGDADRARALLSDADDLVFG